MLTPLFTKLLEPRVMQKALDHARNRDREVPSLPVSLVDFTEHWGYFLLRPVFSLLATSYTERFSQNLLNKFCHVHRKGSSGNISSMFPYFCKVCLWVGCNICQIPLHWVDILRTPRNSFKWISSLDPDPPAGKGGRRPLLSSLLL